jgi:hypothetical protein
VHHSAKPRIDEDRRRQPLGGRVVTMRRDRSMVGMDDRWSGRAPARVADGSGLGEMAATWLLPATLVLVVLLLCLP